MMRVRRRLACCSRFPHLSFDFDNHHHCHPLPHNKENIVTTRLLIPTSDIMFLNEGNISFSEMKKLTGADIENLPREKIPPFVPIEYEILQIVGEIKP